jgi:Spy/CpxP family protein refolding chaperone
MKAFYYLSVPLALLLSASSSHAGSPEEFRGRQGPDMEERMERLAEELDLSTEQTDQLQSVMEAAADEREALREKYARQMKPELCSLHLATMEQVREILSEEQAQELEEKLERWGPGGGPGGRHPGKGRPWQDCEEPD